MKDDWKGLEQSMISVICPYSNSDLMQNCLIKSIKKQSYLDYEIISLNNKELNMHSAAEVLNYGVSLSRGDIIAFSHQDIELLDDHIFQSIVDFCATHEFGVASVAGTSIAKHNIYSSVVQGPKKEQAGISVQFPMIVDTCDECFFFVKRDSFRSFSDLGQTWHFYAVEYCLRCILAGIPVYVLPLNVYHLSPGWSLNKSYWDTLLKVAKKYKGDIDIIPTTMGIFYNRWFLPFYVLLKRLQLWLIKTLRANDKP